MNSDKIKNLTLIGMFAAALAVLSQISIPMPSNVPLTLQTFAVAFIGCFLGWKRGTLSVLVYILLGAVGVPVFSGFKGGIGSLFGFTGGFIFGFLILAALCGLGYKKNVWIALALCLAGLAATHICGVLWFTFLSKNTVGASFALVSLPYLLKDALSVIAAYFAAEMLKKRVDLGIDKA